MLTEERLQGIKNDLEEGMNSISLDFVGDHEIKDSCYLSDAFTEYADGATSIYYSDQRKYYYDHSEECDRALSELYSGEDLAELIRKEGLDALICKAGACGEYEANYQELAEDEDNIRKLLVVRWLIKNEIYNLEIDQLWELLEEAGYSIIDRIDELKDLVDQYTSEEK